MPLRAFAQDRQVEVIFRGDNHGIRLGVIEHLDVIGIELHIRGNSRLRSVDKFSVRIGNADEFRVRLGGKVFEQPPDVVVIQANDGDTGLRLRRLREWRSVRRPRNGER